MPYAYFYGRVSHQDSADRKYDETSETCNSVDHQFVTCQKKHEFEREMVLRSGGDQSKLPPPWAKTGWIGRKQQGVETHDGRYVDQEVSAYKIPFRLRPAGMRLHARLKPGDTLYVAYMHRAFRNWKDFGFMLDYWNKNKIRVVFCVPDIDLTTIVGEAFAAVLSIFDTMHSRLASESRTAEAAWRRANGYLISKLVPMGWIAVKVGRRKKLAPDNPLREAVIRAQELRAAGVSWRDLSDTIEQEQANVEGREPAKQRSEYRFTFQKLCKATLLTEAGHIPLPSRLLPPGFKDLPHRLDRSAKRDANYKLMQQMRRELGRETRRKKNDERLRRQILHKRLFGGRTKFMD